MVSEGQLFSRGSFHLPFRPGKTDRTRARSAERLDCGGARRQNRPAQLVTAGKMRDSPSSRAAKPRLLPIGEWQNLVLTPSRSGKHGQPAPDEACKGNFHEKIREEPHDNLKVG